jgi:hypothetical protein
MIFAKGFGCFVIPLFFVPLMIIGRMLRYFGLNVFTTESWLPLHSLMILGAVVSFIVGRLLNRNTIKEVIYEKSGPEILYKPRHTLYWIRMEYWGPILLVIYFVCWLLFATIDKPSV